MVAFSEADQVQDVTLQDVAVECEQVPAQVPGCGELPTDADHLVLADTRPLGGVGSTIRALLRPLIALASAQSVLVAVIGGLVSITIAFEAAKTINAALVSIIAALKRI